MSRSEPDGPVLWRVGRRRLAWRPGSSGPPEWLQELFDFPYVGFGLFFFTLFCMGVFWMCSLLATAAVWPIRMLVDRWLVVAYPVGATPLTVSRRVRGRAAADALARQWAADIEKHGRPGGEQG